LSVPAFGATSISLASTVTAADDLSGEVLVVEVGDRRAFWWFAEARDSKLPTADFTASATRVDGGVEVRIVAKSVIRDLALLADIAAPDASVDRMLITLLPGDEAVIKVTTGWSGDPGRFVDGDVLRSMNDLVH
jgi:beta-mannosidase